MKKMLILLAMVSVFTMSLFAQNNQKNDDCWTDLSYENVPILKILESNDGYLVLYQKNRVGTGRTVIPKSWIRGTVENPRKLKFRSVKSANEAYMSIMKDNGEFLRVVINVPESKLNPIWGVVGTGVQLPDVDKDVLEELDL